jgi:shikimate 5-dehydrogenase
MRALVLGASATGLCFEKALLEKANTVTILNRTVDKPNFTTTIRKNLL